MAPVAAIIIKKYWYIPVIILLVVAIILFFVFRKKKMVIESPKPVELTNEATGQTEQFQPGLYTDALWQELDRNSLWSGRNLKPYKDLLALQTSQFKAVSNDWNSRYFERAKGRNLFQRINAEKGYSLLGGSLFDTDHAAFAEIRDSIIERAKKLGIY